LTTAFISARSHGTCGRARGSTAVKSDELFAGYYKRPEVTAGVFDPDGYYRTGDLVAEIGPGRLVYLDRRNNDFVPVSRRDATFGKRARVDQVAVRPETA
jgi:fatty acid CoA ligase FadD9